MRLRAEERYHDDPVFRQLVDVIYHYIDVSNENGLQYTPTELREAAMLAAVKWENTHIRPRLVFTNDLDPETWILRKPGY